MKVESICRFMKHVMFSAMQNAKYPLMPGQKFVDADVRSKNLYLNTVVCVHSHLLYLIYTR